MLVPFSVWTVLQVGPGGYARIEDAVAAARPGDTVRVAAGEYPKTAVRITTPRLTILAQGRVVLDGKGFDYSGAGPVPRAVFQIAADGVRVEGFEIRGAHNAFHNGAGVRIDAARGATILSCDVHGNDLGIMSNGREGDPTAGEGQTIERCHIHHNGDPEEPGYNHNLYLGGTSATLRFCEIDHATTGHNLKSRAHLTRVEFCWIHDAANREIDFVDAWDTARKGSDAVVLGCVIAKDPDCAGNRGVVHFGRENGRRVGTLRLVNDTLTTPFSSPAILLSGGEVATEIKSCEIAAKATVEGGPSTVDAKPRAPGFRWAGGGKWAPTKAGFVGAGSGASP